MIDHQFQLSEIVICTGNITWTNLVPRVYLGGRDERSCFLGGTERAKVWEKIEASKVIKK